MWNKYIHLALFITFLSSFNISQADNQLNPTDDFYAWVNNDWLEAAVIPDEKPAVSNFSIINEKVLGQLKTMLSVLQSSTDKSKDEQKVVDLYNDYMNIDRRNNQGITPIESDLKAIEAIKTVNDVFMMFAKLQKTGVPVPLLYGVSADYKHSDKHLVALVPGGLGLGKDILDGKDERSEKQKKLYTELLSKLFILAKFDQSEDRAKQVLNLEKQLASIQWTKVETRNIEKIYNIVDQAQLEAMLDSVPASSYMNSLGIASQNRYMIMQPPYMKGLNNLIGRTSIDTWKNYFRARILSSFAGLLTSEFKAAETEFNIKKGLIKKESAMWKQSVRFLTGNVEQMLGKLYIEHYSSEKIKAKILDVIGNIKEEYRLSISNSEIFTAATKKKALNKLAKMRYNVGYPNKWKDYSSLDIQPGNLIDNYKNIATFDHHHDLDKLDKPVDKSEWSVSPHIVNAFYSPTKNKFVLLAAILNEPFFSLDADYAEIYGGIGFVIAHEIGHAFDDTGSRFDANGNLNNWWQEIDHKKYTKLKNALIKQANEYEILPGVTLNGELEIGEIIGDLNGAQIALRAYQKIINEKNLDKFNAQKKFLKQIAKTWRLKIRQEYLLYLIASDPHPHSEFRTNRIVKRIDEFHEVFATMPGEKMYLQPEQRISMW